MIHSFHCNSSCPIQANPAGLGRYQKINKNKNKPAPCFSLTLSSIPNAPGPAPCQAKSSGKKNAAEQLRYRPDQSKRSKSSGNGSPSYPNSPSPGQRGPGDGRLNGRSVNRLRGKLQGHVRQTSRQPKTVLEVHVPMGNAESLGRRNFSNSSLNSITILHPRFLRNSHFN